MMYERVCMVLSKCISEGATMLKNSNVAEYELDAWYLAEHVFDVTRMAYLMSPNQVISEENYDKYMDMIQLRCTHVPLQHIIGVQEFMGLEFLVNEHVLIPRQDTECLVEEVLQYSKGKSVLDICTGSGCIIISIEKLGQVEKADAIDISKDALSVAQENATRLGANVEFYESDLFSQITQKYDIIVSNPPYIPTKVIEGLMEEVRDHEPFIALDGKEDGLLLKIER